MKVAIASHPHTSFDEVRLRMLVAATPSLTVIAKIELLTGLGSYAQHEIDAIITGLEHDARAHGKRAIRTGLLILDLFGDVPLDEAYAAYGPLEPALIESALSNETVAAVLESAIDNLLGPLGESTARTVMAAFFGSLAENIRGGAPFHLTGTTDELFGALPLEQRKQVTPALSTLRSGREVIVVYEQQTFAVRLTIGGDFGSQGRKQTARTIGVSVRRHQPETTALRLLAEDLYLLPPMLIGELTWQRMISALGPAGDVIDAWGKLPTLVDSDLRRKSKAEDWFSLVTQHLFRVVLARLLITLPAESKERLLCGVFEWSLTRSVAHEIAFTDAYLEAVDILPERDEATRVRARHFIDVLRASHVLAFVDRLLLLKAYADGSDAERLQLLTLLDFATMRVRDEDAPYTATPWRPDADLPAMLAPHVTDVDEYLATLRQELGQEASLSVAPFAGAVSLLEMTRFARNYGRS